MASDDHSKNVSNNMNSYSIVKQFWIVNVNKNDATIKSPFSVQ